MKPKIKFFYAFFIISFLSHLSYLFGIEKTRIVTTTSTLASMTETIAGDGVDIYFIASPERDIHFIAPTPKDVLKVKKADVFIHQGLDLEVWRDPLLAAAGNPAFFGNGKAAIDASKGISLLEVPASLSRAEGDIHMYGNPHYATDPENMKIMINNVAEGLAQNFPDKAGKYREKARELNLEIDSKMKDWQNRMAPYKGTAVVTYHKSWPYLTQRFRLVEAGQLEPKPGIPPTAKHLAELVKIMKEKNVRIIIKESYNERRAAEKVARETGAAIVNLDQNAVKNEKGKPDFLETVEKNISKLENALRAGGAAHS